MNYEMSVHLCLAKITFWHLVAAKKSGKKCFTVTLDSRKARTRIPCEKPEYMEYKHDRQ